MLKTENLFYSLKNKKCIIKQLSLSFLPGTIHAILGPNGSGKSSLLKLLVGIIKPTSGGVYWNGENLALYSRRERSQILSLVPQTPQVTFNYTVKEIIAMGIYPITRSIEHANIDAVLKQVDIEHLKDQEVITLSSGERQRVYIARSLMTNTPVLLLDEPTANLDIKYQLDVWRLLNQLKQDGKVIIVTTHDFTAVQEYCDTITLLKKGTHIATGSYREVMTPSSLKNTYDLSNSNLVLGARGALAGLGEPAHCKPALF